MVYLDNIIVYLNSEREHKKYIKWVLSKLYKKNILVAVKKCKFYIKKTDFIGFIIKLGRISINPNYITVGLNSPFLVLNTPFHLSLFLIWI